MITILSASLSHSNHLKPTCAEAQSVWLQNGPLLLSNVLSSSLEASTPVPQAFVPNQQNDKGRYLLITMSIIATTSVSVLIMTVMIIACRRRKGCDISSKYGNFFMFFLQDKIYTTGLYVNVLGGPEDGSPPSMLEKFWKICPNPALCHSVTLFLTAKYIVKSLRGRFSVYTGKICGQFNFWFKTYFILSWWWF